MNPCGSNPCANGGTCADIGQVNGGGYTCTCSSSYTGRNISTTYAT